MRRPVFLLCLLFTGCTGKSENITGIVGRVLKLHAAMAIDVPEQVEPSGLTMRNDSLFTISDDHDHTIFYVAFDTTQKSAVLKPFLEFTAPVLPAVNHLDFEGITVDPAGNFYLVSEEAFRILKVSAGGQSAEWVTPDLQPFGAQVGLFKKNNANFEGLSITDDKNFTLCAEREPRGIMQLNLADLPQSITAIKQDHAVLPSPGRRTADYAGLAFFNGSIFCLERGIHAVTELSISDGKISEKSLWTFAHVENDAAWRYENMEYGHAEGLFVNKDFVYIIIDNNGDARQDDNNDRRPLLFIFAKP